jgi:hypothetical protein
MKKQSIRLLHSRGISNYQSVLSHTSTAVIHRLYPLQKRSHQTQRNGTNTRGVGHRSTRTLRRRSTSRRRASARSTTSHLSASRHAGRGPAAAGSSSREVGHGDAGTETEVHDSGGDLCGRKSQYFFSRSGFVYDAYTTYSQCLLSSTCSARMT